MFRIKTIRYIQIYRKQNQMLTDLLLFPQSNCILFITKIPTILVIYQNVNFISNQFHTFYINYC